MSTRRCKMRATMSGYYRNLQFDQGKVAKELFDVTKQISSGQKIQYSYEDVSSFVDTVRLDNEVTTLTQTKQNAQKALQFSSNTDSTMTQMTKIMDAMKVKLVSAATDSHSPESLNAIALELRGLEKNLKQLANTSIDGKYLFSGSDVNTKPIDDNGIYQGNDGDIKTFLGSGVEQKYNITGADLFLGEENDTQRKISLNMPQFSQTLLFPDVMIDPAVPRTDAKEEYLTTENTIRDLMGDSDEFIDVGTAKHFFYLRGTQSDGTSFKEKIAMSDDETMGDLLNRIGQAFGNTAQGDLVEVSMNKNGQIEILDKLTGSSKLDFHMVGATDFTGGAAADVADIDLLDVGETNLGYILDGTSTAANPNLYVKSFMQSGLTPSGVATNIEALKYDRVNFETSGAKLLGNVSQIVVDDNAYAQDATQLSHVFSALDKSAPLPYPPLNSLAGEQLLVSGTDVTGAAFNLQIDLGAAGSTFSLDGGVTNFDIFNVATPRVSTPADDVSYRQFMDVLNIALSGTAPGPNTAVGYDASILTAETASSVNLDNKGKIVFEEYGVTDTLANMAIFDSDSTTFPAGLGAGVASSLTFNANNTLEISDAKTDFFAQIDSAITSVELARSRADGNRTDPRNGGIQNAIQAIDDLSAHLFSQNSVAGVQSQTLQVTEDRTDLLVITTKSLRSDTIDVDIAEASLELQQLTLNYQAMLSTVSRVTQLSLVNYL